MSEEEVVHDDEILALDAKLRKLVDNNVAIENDLRSRQVGVNPWVIVQMRMDMLLNVILDDKARYEFEIESAHKVNAILMQIQQETAKPRGSGLLLPDKNPLQIA